LEYYDDETIDAAAQAYVSEKEAKGLITEWQIERDKKKRGNK
jgi:hypothetical protein